MMIADNKIYAQFLGISNLVKSLYTTIQDYYQLYSALISIVNPFVAHSVAFVITVGNIIVYIRVKLL